MRSTLYGPDRRQSSDRRATVRSARYLRLAEETTGKVRRVLLKMGHDPQDRRRSPAAHPNVIELYPMADDPEERPQAPAKFG